MPQGSILGPLLFNIDLTDLFTCENYDIASYTDDKTPYTCARATPTVISELQSTSEKLFNWFEKNHHKNLQSLAIEIYNFVNGLSSEIMNSVFHLKEYNRYSLRNVYQLYSRDLRTVKYGMEIISYLAPKIMVYSTSDHNRKHFRIFLQNKNKEMETRMPRAALQEIFATCWFCIKVNFISLVNPPCDYGL